MMVIWLENQENTFLNPSLTLSLLSGGFRYSFRYQTLLLATRTEKQQPETGKNTVGPDVRGNDTTHTTMVPLLQGRYTAPSAFTS